MLSVVWWNKGGLDGSLLDVSRVEEEDEEEEEEEEEEGSLVSIIPQRRFELNLNYDPLQSVRIRISNRDSETKKIFIKWNKQMSKHMSN